MTVYGLIAEHRRRFPSSHFFDSETLRFFGERISEMRVLRGVVTVKDISGHDRRAYVLSSRQRKAPGGPRRKYHYFDAETFDDIVMP